MKTTLTTLDRHQNEDNKTENKREKNTRFDKICIENNGDIALEWLISKADDDDDDDYGTKLRQLALCWRNAELQLPDTVTLLFTLATYRTVSVSGCNIT